jgi:GNAT superfamily N-acetyltransferase
MAKIMRQPDILFEKAGVVSACALKSFLLDLILWPVVLFRKGMTAGFKRLIQLSGKAIYQRADYIAFSKDLSEETDGRFPVIRIHRLAGQNDLSRLTTITDPHEAKFFQKIIGDGGLGFIAYKEDEVVGWAWYHPPDARKFVFFQPSLRPEEVYFHDLFVFPEFRGQGIARQLMRGSLAMIRNLGYKRILSLIATDNISSAKAHENVGYVRIGRIRHRRFLLWNSVRTRKDDIG